MCGLKKLEQLERLCSEDAPRRLMITHTIDQFILLTSSYRKNFKNLPKIQIFRFWKKKRYTWHTL